MVELSQLVHRLPTHLQERCRILKDAALVDDRASGMVLYWMRTAMRTDENPALDVASWLAAYLQVPLCIYQGLSERYPYASDRHHTFILEGAKDVANQCAEKNLAYGFHLEERGQQGNALRDIADIASIVFTEDMPTDPSLRFIRALRRSTKCCLLGVDTACVVPMRIIGRAYTRAFEYRDATKSEYALRVEKPWPERRECPKQFDLTRLPFQALDFSKTPMELLVSGCNIDHSVGPVLDTEGGSKAGNQRWERFRDSQLGRYAKQRNNPLLDGVSRMSAYLHYGMVSPMKLAREANECRSEGASKFLDELLIWRELAYAFCHYRRDHARWTALPDWARNTLTAHRSDPGRVLYSWSELARGATKDELWNAAQQSLLIHGELHNNVRMTWGKAILEWVRNPQEALRIMIDLNHRYALDGRDPASYGGLLWCLGQFDRPFTPEQPIFGLVRPRTTSEHAERLDVAKYAAKVSRSRAGAIPSIGIIGAGISGCIAAQILSDHGLGVTIYEKSRGVGGRMATKRHEFDVFDHGAQYFTVSDPLFARYVHAWVDEGIVASWTGKIAAFQEFGKALETPDHERLVGTPNMTAIARHLSQGMDLRLNTQVASLVRSNDKFELCDSSGLTLGMHHRILITAPAPQTKLLLAVEPRLEEQVAAVHMEPCWCVMARFHQPLDVPWNGAFVNCGPLRWIARNQTKPDRTAEGCNELIVLHANSLWSSQHMDHDPQTIQQLLLDAFWNTIGRPPIQPISVHTHRWRYSIPSVLLAERCVANESRTLLAAGDWAGGPKVEGAFLSGVAAAGKILGTLERPLRQKSQAMLF